MPVTEIGLVGHSMGGLVVRTACAEALCTAADQLGGPGADPEARAGQRWVDRVTHVVTLGAPHGGSWLAQAAHRCSSWAARVPEGRGVAALLELRSRGIRDLTRGAAAGLDLASQMPNAQHAFVSAGLAAPFNLVVGDGLVHRDSATAPASSHANVVVRHVPGVGHIRLLNHPVVGDDLLAWFGPRRVPAGAPVVPGSPPSCATG